MLLKSCTYDDTCAAIFLQSSSWSDLHLPVCHALLLRSRYYLCSLVMRFAQLALSEASKITTILVSIKCARATQLHTTIEFFSVNNVIFCLHAKWLKEVKFTHFIGHSVSYTIMLFTHDIFIIISVTLKFVCA